MPDDRNRYVGYEDWKAWHDLFSYTSDNADYFAGEMRGLAVENADLLEIGFGSGDFLQWAIDRGARVAATEINPVLLAAAESRGIELLDDRLEQAAVAASARFDTIVAFDVFEHLTIDEISAGLMSVERMLKPGGHFVLRFPNAQSPFGLVAQHGDPTHRSYLSLSVFEQLIQPGNLEVARYGHVFRPRGRTLVALLVRRFRYLCQDVISRMLDFVYATRVPWEPVVVLVLRRRAGPSAADGDG